jgi:dolichyl-phosphate-mannose-protein mannosyltransferase
VRRALRAASEILFLALLALVVGQAAAKPFAPYEALVKSWLPEFSGVLALAILLLAVRDAARDDPDGSPLARVVARAAAAAGRRPALAEAVGLGVVLVLALLVSLALYDRGTAPLDEGLNVVGASGLLHGRMLYRDLVLVYPPGVFVVIAEIFRLFGESLWAVRVAAVVLQFALVLAAWALVRKTSGSRLYGVLAAALALAFGLSQGHFLLTAAWLALLASLLALRAFETTPRALWIAGALAAVTALFKQDDGAFVLAGFAVAAWLDDGSARAKVGRLVRLAAPVVLATAAAAAWLVSRGVPLSDQWACLVARPLGFETSAHHALPIPGPWSAPIAWLPLALHAGAALTLAAERRRGRRVDPRVVAAIVYGLFLQTGWWARADLWHLAYAIGPAFVAAPKAIEGARRLAERMRRPILSGAFLGCVLPVGFTIYQLEKYPLVQAFVAHFRTPWAPLETERARGIFVDPRERDEIDGAVRWIRMRCAPGESFFVAPISPLLYFLADRPPAARFVLVTTEFGTSPEEQASILDDLRRSKPKLLLLNVQPFDGLPFRELAPELWRACFAGRKPEHAFGEWLSFAGMP